MDEQIAELVSVLSAFEGVYTYESCEASILGAYVCLHYGSPTQPLLTDTVQFADFIAKALDGTDCTVSVEWSTVPNIVLRLHPDAIAEVVSKLVCHKTLSSHDSRDKALGN